MNYFLLGFTGLVFLLFAQGCASQPDADPLKYFSEAEIEKAKSYHGVTYIVFFLRLGVTAAFFLVFIYSGAARYLDRFIAQKLSIYPLRVLAYFAIFYVIYMAVGLPLSFYRFYIVEHKYGFSNQTAGGWFLDVAKGGAVSLVLGGVLVTGLYLLIKISPKWWWLLSAGAFAVYLAIIILFKPVVIDPLFNKFTPMADDEMRAGIVSLAGKAGIEVGEVLVMDASRRTSHTNAYFTGWGSTKRIVVYDTLLDNHTKPEVLSIVAHEIGHWRHSHIYIGFGIAVAGTVLALFIVKLAGGLLVARMPLGADSLASPASLVLVLMVLYVCGLFSMPVENAISRSFERQADAAALELTGDGRTFVEMQVKLARANASDPVPPAFCYFWFYSHPSTMERIAMGERYGD